MLAVIGGSGLYGLDGLEPEDGGRAETPFGRSSGNLVRGRLDGRPILTSTSPNRTHPDGVPR